MFGVECFDTHDEPISHYTQWDINQTLKIVLYGMDDGYMKNAPYVHFANIKSSEALVVRSTLQGDDTVLVDIPNQLLQEPYPLLIYVYLNDSSDAGSQRTIVKIEIPVHKRARPSDYEYVENINRITAEAIKQEIYDDFMDEVGGGNIAYPYVTFIDESTGKHVNLKVSDEKFGLYVDSTNRQLLDTGDIVNNLMTNSSTKALSASMGATIKNMVDVIPDNIDEKIEEHDSSPTSHSDIRDDISSMSSTVDTMQDSIAEIENKIDDIDFRLDDSISGSGVLTTTDTLVNSSPIEMKIKGNTRQNLWVNPIATKNGITITNADDGAITISGSATATTTVTTDKIYTMKAGVTYSIGADKLTPVNGFVFSVHQYSSEDRLLAGSDSITYASKGRTITTNAQMAYVKFVVVIPSGTSVSETYHIMLNAGEELESWCAPGLNSIDEVSIVTAGKNLVDIDDIVDRTVDGYYDPSHPSCPMLPVGTYTVSADIESTLEPFGVDITVGDNLPTLEVNNTADVKHNGRVSLTFTLDARHAQYKNIYFRLCRYQSRQTYTYSAKNIQLELGSTATVYEPPVTTTVPIDLDGHSLRSLTDGTCDELTVDINGAVTLVQRVGVTTFDGSEDEAWSYNNKRIGLDNGAPGSGAMNLRVNGRCDTLPVRVVSSSTSIMSYDSGWVDLRNDSVITDAETGKAWLAANHTTLLYPLAEPKTITLTSVTLSSFPSDKSNICTTSNIQTAGLTVRYWKKSGDLVANLYKLLLNAQREIL